jgi:hypothetical protein
MFWLTNHLQIHIITVKSAYGYYINFSSSPVGYCHLVSNYCMLIMV